MDQPFQNFQRFTQNNDTFSPQDHLNRGRYQRGWVDPNRRWELGALTCTLVISRMLRHLLVDRAQVDVCVVAETRFLEGRGESSMK